MQDRIKTAKHYRQRAKELRSISEGIFDQEERKNLLAIADEYEQMAREIETK